MNPTVFQNLPTDLILWIGEMVESKLKVCLWTQPDADKNCCDPSVIYFIEHSVMCTEFNECTQKAPSAITADKVTLLMLADFEDYEKHCIIDVVKELSTIDFRDEELTRWEKQQRSLNSGHYY